MMAVRGRWLAAVLAIGMGASFISSGAATATGPKSAPTYAQRYAEGRLLVRFASGMSDAAIDAVNARLGAATIRSYHIVPGLRLIGLSKSMDVPAAVSAYTSTSGVLYAEPDFISHVDDTIPNDTSFSTQWDWQNTGQIGGTPGVDVDAAKAWDLSTGSNTVVVGVIDTGIQVDPHPHVDLEANMWHNMPECTGTPGVDDEGDGYVDDCYGIDTINHDSDPNDDYNHGTHVAGTIGAVGNNALGVTGMNWHVTILACKSHDNTGNGTNDSLLECLQFIQDWKGRGLNIVATNNSYGGCNEACSYSQSLYDAIKAQMDVGILYVASAGNDNADNDVTIKYPTDYYLPNVIGVAATTNTDTRASFSNWGHHTVSVGAPGQSIYSTLFTDFYGYESGTSMASPHVVGLAALLAAYNPSLDWRAIRNLLISGGEEIPAMAGITISGRRLNAYGSLTCSNQTVFGALRPLPNATGGTQTLSVLNINCASPAGPITATINGQRVALRDDGHGPDLARADGIYSGSWTPCAAGAATIDYSNGETDTTTVAGLTPCINVRPHTGPPGSQTTVFGRGFSPNEAVTINFDGVFAASATANSSGTFSKAITVPASATHGRHTVSAVGATSLLSTETTYRVT
jgi:subtilisin family serine protease